MENAREYMFFAAGLAILAVLYLGMHLLAIRFKLPQLRKAGFRLAVFGSLVVLMYGLGFYTKDFESTGLVMNTNGPSRGQASVLRELAFPVTEDMHRQSMELTMSGRDEPSGPLKVCARVLDPAGRQVLVVEQSVDRGEGKLWCPLQFSFAPAVIGGHRLAIEIPEKVDSLRLIVKELR